MSYLSNELTAALKRYGLKQKDVVKASGVGVAPVSRIFSGVQEFVSSEMLDKIMQVVAKTPQERGRIIRARLRDAYDGKDAYLIQINVKGGAPPSKRFTPSDVSIDPDVNAAFEYLYEQVPVNPQVGPLVVLQAKALGLKE